MESRTENAPAPAGDPEPAEPRAITQLYRLLGDRVPSIAFVPQWDTWVYQGDIPISQFESLAAYLDEFPYQVTVSPSCIVITDPGFGKGAMEWVCRLLDLEGGHQMLALTETDAHSENHECKIWIGQYIDDEWEDLTEIVLPPITRSSFFGPEADGSVLEDFELVTLQYTLPSEGLGLAISAQPNLALECIDGRVMVDDLEPADEARICKAWTHYRPTQIHCTFDPRAGRYLLQTVAVRS